MEAQKIFMYAHIMYVIVIIQPTSNLKVVLSMILTRSISNIFVTYFYYSKKNQNLYLFYYKLNGEANSFMFYLRNFYLLSYFYVNNCFIFNWILGKLFLFFTLPCLHFTLIKKNKRLQNHSISTIILSFYSRGQITHTHTFPIHFQFQIFSSTHITTSPNFLSIILESSDNLTKIVIHLLNHKYGN